MYVVKKFYTKDDRTLLISRAFDDAVKRVEMPFDTLEFIIGDSVTKVADDAATVGIDAYSPLLEDGDPSLARILVKHELFRAYCRRFTEAPKFMEDVFVGREMAKHNSDELSYLYYVMIVKNPLKKEADLLRLHLPWMVFWNTDHFYFSLFEQLAQQMMPRHAEKNRKFDRFFHIIKSDLLKDENMARAIKFYGDFHPNRVFSIGNGKTGSRMRGE